MVEYCGWDSRALISCVWPNALAMATKEAREMVCCCSNFAIVGTGTPLIAGLSNLYDYQPESDCFDRITVLTEEEKKRPVSLSTLCLVPHQGVLVGTDRAGLKYYDWKQQTTETLIPDIQVRDITQTEAHTFWIASESGIYILNWATRSITHLQKSLTNEYTISDNAVYSITQDREGGIWATTFFGGVNYLPKRYFPFRYFIGGKTYPEMLGNAVREICPDQYGNIWLGTEDNGINCYNPASRRITNYSRSNPRHPLSATNIHGLLADGDKLWVGTFNTGIDLLDIPSGKVVERYTHTNTHQRLPSDFVLCFCQLSDDEILIGTVAGLTCFHKKEKRFTAWCPEIRSMVRQIYQDTQGDIWMATTSGAYRYTPSTQKLHHYTADRIRPDAIGDNSVTSIFEDSRRRIWVSTVYGFSLYNRNDIHSCREVFGQVSVSDADAVIICATNREETVGMCRCLGNRNIPYFMAGTEIPDTDPVASFSADQEASGRLAARLLSTLGTTPPIRKMQTETLLSYSRSRRQPAIRAHSVNGNAA